MIIQTFPTLIYSEKFARKASQNETLQQCLKEAYQFREMDEKGRKWCEKNYPNGFTSYSSIRDLSEISPNYEDLGNQIDEHIAKYLKQLGFQIKMRDLERINLWVNIMNKGCWHAIHTHPNSIISGTLYLKTSPKSSAIIFEDPRSPLFMNSPARPVEKSSGSKNKNLPTKYELHPKNGQIILFESWLRHEVPLQKESSARVSVSFNYNWKR